MRGAKLVRLTLSAALIAGMVSVTGCGTTTDNNAMHTKSLRNHTTRNYNVNSLQPRTSLHNAQNRKMSTMKHDATLSNKVAQLSDVQNAHVIVTDRDAYVAVTLHNQKGGNTNISKLGTLSNGSRNVGTSNVGGPYGANYGTRGAGDDGLARITGRAGTNGIMNPGRSTTYGTYGANNYGTGYGTYGANNYGTGVGTYNNYGAGYGAYNTNNYGTMYRTDRNTNYGTYGTYGTTTGTDRNLNNVGQVVDNVPQKVKDEISRIVKKSDPKIQNVYVSNHPEFVNNVGGYVTQSRGGTMLNNAVGDFEKLVERIFPSRTGTMTGPNGYTPTPNNMDGVRGITR
ncbi:YhcN/YlaJ family sporulation lipoprotein [Paenibacillus segetis]|uniref:Sporulation lipoprotein, YhcN/YlaJ family n=1 Tax=Paenibacillus segetis TaxID=1325360 RepID=A0ABQ1YRC5_9BACL|nr:YhcN/YlaJ family sporulation lipoprotein [Paenibacillus segetis]GGH33928.1 hypothetical protein GCM10008013_39370 [Paenibacillus segetis]